MDQKLIDTSANPRQTNIGAKTEIRELSLDELDHVAGGFLKITMQQVFVTSLSSSSHGA